MRGAYVIALLILLVFLIAGYALYSNYKKAQQYNQAQQQYEQATAQQSALQDYYDNMGSPVLGCNPFLPNSKCGAGSGPSFSFGWGSIAGMF